MTADGLVVYIAPMSHRQKALTANEIRVELRHKGWRVKNGAWASPRHKRDFQRLTLSEAASMEALIAGEKLPAY